MKQFFTRKDHPSLAVFEKNNARVQAMIAPIEEQNRLKRELEAQRLLRLEDEVLFKNAMQMVK